MTVSETGFQSYDYRYQSNPIQFI